MEPADSLKNREAFAVSLRKKKKETIIQEKRRKLYQIYDPKLQSYQQEESKINNFINTDSEWSYKQSSLFKDHFRLNFSNRTIVTDQIFAPA